MNKTVPVGFAAGVLCLLLILALLLHTAHTRMEVVPDCPAVQPVPDAIGNTITREITVTIADPQPAGTPVAPGARDCPDGKCPNGNCPGPRTQSPFFFGRLRSR